LQTRILDELLEGLISCLAKLSGELWSLKDMANMGTFKSETQPAPKVLTSHLLSLNCISSYDNLAGVNSGQNLGCNYKTK